MGKKVQENSILDRKVWTFQHLKDKSVLSYFAGWVSSKFGVSTIYNVLEDGCANNQFVLHLRTDKRGGATVGAGCIPWKALGDGADFSTYLRPQVYSWKDIHASKWEECAIGAVTKNQHDDSMRILSHNKTIGIDQARFDALQGVHQKPSFLHDLGTGKRSDFIGLSASITRRMFVSPTTIGSLPTKGSGSRKRMSYQLPLGTPTSDNKMVWTLHADSYMLEQLSLDPSMIKIAMMAETRGKDNTAISLNMDGYKFGNVVVLEAPSSITERTQKDILVLEDTVHVAGLRRYAVVDGVMIWEGCKEFTVAEDLWFTDPTTVKIYSRGVIVGNGALCEGLDTKGLEYTYDTGPHAKCSSSLLQVPYGVKRTRLKAENEVCDTGFAEVDYAIINVDMLHTPLVVCQEPCTDSTQVFPMPMVTGEDTTCVPCTAVEPCADSNATVVEVL